MAEALGYWNLHIVTDLLWQTLSTPTRIQNNNVACLNSLIHKSDRMAEAGYWNLHIVTDLLWQTLSTPTRIQNNNVACLNSLIHKSDRIHSGTTVFQVKYQQKKIRSFPETDIGSNHDLVLCSLKPIWRALLSTLTWRSSRTERLPMCSMPK